MIKSRFNFQFLWLSFTVSTLGDWLLKIALPIAIYQLTGSGAQMALIYGIQFLPWLFISVFSGIMADRFEERQILFWGNLGAALATSCLAILVYSHTTGFWFYLLIFVQASFAPLMHPAFQSIIARIVDSTRLYKANASLQVVDNTLSLIGPMVGGLLTAIIAPQLAVSIDAASFLLAAILSFAVHPSAKRQTALISESTVSAIKAGFVASYQNKIVWYGALLFFWTNLGTNMFAANFIYFMRHSLHTSVSIAGITMGLAGIGAIIGSLATPWLSRHFSAGTLIVGTTLLAGIGLVGVGLSHHFLSVAAFYALVNFCGNVNAVVFFSLRQTVIPQAILGRVVSVTRMISYASIPIGSFLGAGLVAAHWPLAVIIVVAGMIRFGAGVFGWFTPLNCSSTVN
ncbi:MFS transporter [Furfurilactobacillus rossiae]|uniref:Permease n=1 Tax=Furfurilactobacillus rossiae DSM 15814 TaxID=1114972 RepID=A0A0R1RFR7_9LACO|nr:MFS transporter [Furfurilactobacillus rossiae]KRL54084.1 permease [Furfurilactobacillus rossiae DSM 15814]QLE60361.1 antibiotic efflux protein [Furfurilactobacillus rossiae]